MINEETIDKLADELTLYKTKRKIFFQAVFGFYTQEMCDDWLDDSMEDRKQFLREHLSKIKDPKKLELLNARWEKVQNAMLVCGNNPIRAYNYLKQMKKLEESKK